MLKWLQRGAFVIVAVFTMGADRSGHWERLGRLDVGPPADHDVLTVPRKVGPLKELMLESRGALELRDIVVTFDDGSTSKPRFDSQMGGRVKSQVLHLSGKRKKIRQIDFTYAPLHKKQGVQLIVSGR